MNTVHGQSRISAYISGNKSMNNLPSGCTHDLSWKIIKLKEIPNKWSQYFRETSRVFRMPQAVLGWLPASGSSGDYKKSFFNLLFSFESRKSFECQLLHFNYFQFRGWSVNCKHEYSFWIVLTSIIHGIFMIQHVDYLKWQNRWQDIPLLILKRGLQTSGSIT